MAQLVVKKISTPATLVTECDSIFCCLLAIFQTVTFDIALIFPQEITFWNYNCIFYLIVFHSRVKCMIS